MKGILTKLGDNYKLYNHDSCIATTHESPHKRLSKENCNKIFSEYITPTYSEYLNSIQQPIEIEVAVEMEIKQQLINGYKNQPDNVIGFIAEYENVLIPKLDENGCLILKKKS